MFYSLLPNAVIFLLSDFLMKVYSENLECVCCLLVSVTASSPFASTDIYAQRPYAGGNSLELVANS